MTDFNLLWRAEADPRFPMGGGTNSRHTYILKKTVCQSERNRTLEGGGGCMAAASPLDLPMEGQTKKCNYNWEDVEPSGL